MAQNMVNLMIIPCAFAKKNVYSAVCMCVSVGGYVCVFGGECSINVN